MMVLHMALQETNYLVLIPPQVEWVRWVTMCKVNQYLLFRCKNLNKLAKRNFSHEKIEIKEIDKTSKS